MAVSATSTGAAHAPASAASPDSPSGPASSARKPRRARRPFGSADHVAAPSRLADLLELFKPRVSTMVVITAAAGAYLAALQSGISPFHISLVQALFGIALVTCGSSALNQALEHRSDAHMRRTAARPVAALQSGISPFHISLVQALFGIALVTCGSSALNQALEHRSDAHMRRTAGRPVAAGRIPFPLALLIGFAAVFAGTLFLVWTTNILTGTLTLLTAAGYVGIYTPLKRITPLNTFIGAFPGALPPLIGWTAVRGLIEWPAVALFAVLFVWQFPHFMAIGWLYRDDYRHGGIRLTATQHPIQDAARSTVIQSLFYAVLMIPVSLWTTWLGVTGRPYAVIATVLGLGYLWATIRFAGILRAPLAPESRTLARNLLKASVLYLPLLLAAMLLNAHGRLLF